MKASEVYLLAAESLDLRLGSIRESRFSCCAIDRVVGYHGSHFSQLACRYAKRMSPDGDMETLQISLNCADSHAVRVLLLLFMHQIALTEELKRERAKR